ncbi:MAG: sugar phosphate isomerase/epimerase [Treponema sp.]|jgi:sugar phosphate isomerase/epimerase|nr:sugar phosphate isomerase/epimerase [Treponema sp.]
MKIGVLADNFHCPLDDALHKASKLGFAGIQIYATSGEFDASLLKNRERLAAYLKLLDGLGLELSALCGDMGGYGFEKQQDNAERIEKTKAVIDLAAACNTKVVTTHIGVIPADEQTPKFSVMLEALDELGLYGKERGVTLAIETGPEKPETLKKFIEQTHGGVGVNLDPANFVMVTGVDPAQAAELLGKHIVHTHVKDGIMKQQADPSVIYRFFAEGGIEDLRMEDYFLETPVGEGAVNFDTYLAALKKTGYDGFFTIEREAGKEPEADIGRASAYIHAKLAAVGY